MIADGEYKKLSNATRFDNLVIFEPENGKETPSTLFRHGLSCLFESLDIDNPSYVTYDGRLVLSDKSVNPLHYCQSILTQYASKLDLLDRYGLDVEFDSDMGDSSNRNEMKFKVINAWSAQEGLSYMTGNFSVSVNSPTSDLVAMVAATVISVKVKSSISAASQQLVVKKPSATITQLQQTCLVPLPLQPPPTSLVKNIPELGRFVVFDCEWYRDDLTENKQKGRAGNIYAFCLVDGQGNVEKLHVNHFADRHAFMSAILDVLGRYNTLAGYAISDGKKGGKEFISDLGHIINNCKQVGLLEKFTSSIGQCHVLDVYKIYQNETVAGFLKAAYKVSYRGESLDAVARAFLGKGKLEGILGINAESLPSDEQLQQKDFELLQILYEISQEIKLPFFETCNAQWPTKWWSSKLTSINYQKVSSDVQQWIHDNTVLKKNGTKKGVVAMGGYVYEPRTGYYVNAICYDVASMYPSMCNIHNISTETINCTCCVDDPNAQIPSEVMDSINAYVMDKKNKAKKQKPRPQHYWICRKQRGQLSEVMADLIRRKIAYRKAGQTLKEKALKILMNSGYGCFKQAYFDYQDPRVSELITAYGQYTLKGFAKFTGEENVIYGDTDSIYLASKNDTLVAEAAKINVDLEVDKEWKILFLTPNKKQYFGITQQGALVHKTLTGMKSDHPAYFNKVAKKLISKEFQELFITSTTATAASEKILTYVRSAFNLLQTEGSISIEDLAYSTEAAKNLYDYASNGKEQKMYREILEDCDGSAELAQAQSQAKHVYRYWKILGAKGKSDVTIHPEKHQLYISKYKAELFKAIKPILAAYGISAEDLEKLQIELVNRKLANVHLDIVG